jgi:cytidylate kinase
MFRIITIEREYGCGAGEIARQLADRLGWKLWDHALTEEIAQAANVDCSAVQRCEERVDSTFQRLAKIFLRGSYERSMASSGSEPFDTDCMVEVGQKVMEKIAAGGNGVIVGRGAPYFLREQPGIFHVFLYAPRGAKLQRLQRQGKSVQEAEDLVDNVDRDRLTFIKHYFNADWPTRSLYHLMINTCIGDENVLSVIRSTMQTLEESRRKIQQRA